MTQHDDRATTYCGKHGVRYRIVESLCWTPETKITLYVNHTSVKKVFLNDREGLGCFEDMDETSHHKSHYLEFIYSAALM